MPKNCMICVCEYAGTDITQKDEKQAKTRQNEHESGRWSNSQSCDSKVNISPSDIQDLAELVLWSILEESQIQPLEF